MVWLANFFLGLATSVLSYFGAHFAKKTVFAAAAVSAALALTTAFIFLLKGLLLGLTYTIPAWAVEGFAMLLPSNVAICLGAIVSARVGRWIYDYHMETLRLVSYIT